MKRLAPPLALAAALALSASTAHARPAASGFYTEAGAGAAAFVGRKAQNTVPGPSFEMRMGYELFSWLAVGARVSMAMHEADVPPPPEGEYFQVYNGHGEARMGFLAGPIGVFIDGGAGLSMISSNVLEKVNVLDPGERFTLSFSAGGGLEYQLVNRHHAFGLAAQGTMLPQWNNTKFVSTRLYYRYTY